MEFENPMHTSAPARRSLSYVQSRNACCSGVRRFVGAVTEPFGEAKGTRTWQKARQLAALSMAAAVATFALLIQSIGHANDSKFIWLSGMGLCSVAVIYAASRSPALVDAGAAILVGIVWLIAFASAAIDLNSGIIDTYFIVNDSFNWLFSPLWMFLAVVLLDSDRLLFAIIVDASSAFFLPGLVGLSGDQLLIARKFQIFHAIGLFSMLVLHGAAIGDDTNDTGNHSSEVKKSGRDGGGEDNDNDGESPTQHHNHGSACTELRESSCCSAKFTRALLILPSYYIQGRPNRKRAEMLSMMLLSLLPGALLWLLLQRPLGESSSQDAESLQKVAAGLLGGTVLLYGLSRTRLYAITATVSITALFAMSYISMAVASWSADEARLLNLIGTALAAQFAISMLGTWGLAFFTAISSATVIWSPQFHPHTLLITAFFTTALMRWLEPICNPTSPKGRKNDFAAVPESSQGMYGRSTPTKAPRRSGWLSRNMVKIFAFVLVAACGIFACTTSAITIFQDLDSNQTAGSTSSKSLLSAAPDLADSDLALPIDVSLATAAPGASACPLHQATISNSSTAAMVKLEFDEVRKDRDGTGTSASFSFVSFNAASETSEETKVKAARDSLLQTGHMDVESLLDPAVWGGSDKTETSLSAFWSKTGAAAVAPKTLFTGPVDYTNLVQSRAIPSPSGISWKISAMPKTYATEKGWCGKESYPPLIVRWAVHASIADLQKLGLLKCSLMPGDNDKTEAIMPVNYTSCFLSITTTTVDLNSPAAGQTGSSVGQLQLMATRKLEFVLTYKDGADLSKANFLDTSCVNGCQTTFTESKGRRLSSSGRGMPVVVDDDGAEGDGGSGDDIAPAEGEGGNQTSTSDVLWDISIATGDCISSVPLLVRVRGLNGESFDFETRRTLKANEWFESSLVAPRDIGAVASVTVGFADRSSSFFSADTCKVKEVVLTNGNSGDTIVWPSLTEQDTTKPGNSSSAVVPSARRLVGTRLRSLAYISSSSNPYSNNAKGKRVYYGKVQYNPKGGASVYRSSLLNVKFPWVTKVIKPKMQPITDLTVVYGSSPHWNGAARPPRWEHFKPDCPAGYESTNENLNEFTNGLAVVLCVKRGGSSYAVHDLQIRTKKWYPEDYTPSNGGTVKQSLRIGWPSCLSGWSTVKQYGTTKKADLNRGASHDPWWGKRRSRIIILCMKKGTYSSKTPLYQLRVRQDDNDDDPFWSFGTMDYDLNNDVSGRYTYLLYSRSKTMKAAAIAAVSGHTGDGTSRVDDPEDDRNWMTAVEYPAQGRVEVTMRIKWQLGSWAATGESTPTQADITHAKSLFVAGVEEFWSGSITHAGITLDVKPKVVFVTSGSYKTVAYCLRDMEVWSDSKRSSNPDTTGLYAMKLWYNRVKAGYGNVPCCSDDDDPSTCVGTMSQCMSSTREVQDFKRTSAHELGHSVLHAFGGRTHSWWHKGSSTGAIGQNRLGGPKWQCPPPDGTGRHLDLMVYYGSSEDPPCPDRNTMSYATKWDLAKMLMASSSYSINNSP